MNYDDQMAKVECAGQMHSISLLSKQSITVSENIDLRISSMENQITRLKKVKHLLAEGKLLEVSIDDLRFAMQY